VLLQRWKSSCDSAAECSGVLLRCLEVEIIRSDLLIDGLEFEICRNDMHLEYVFCKGQQPTSQYSMEKVPKGKLSNSRLYHVEVLLDLSQNRSEACVK
jgi:hypothetical protein